MDNSHQYRHLGYITRCALAACLTLLLVISVGKSVQQARAACTLQNPIVSPGQDPSIWYAHGLYYLVQSKGGSILLRAAPNLGGLAKAQNRNFCTATDLEC